MSPLRPSEHSPLRRKPMPRWFGPWRAAAWLESQDGWCCVCENPIPLKADGKRAGVFTCGRAKCKRNWGTLCGYDQAEKKNAATSSAGGAR